MRTIDADAKITALLYDEEHEETNRVEMTIADFLDSHTEEGCPQNGGWISVKDRLPELGEPYFAACRSLRDDREPWVIEGIYNLVTHDKPWGVLLVAIGEAEVYAWMPKVYPEPPEEVQ